jgi:hypothetical protein
LPLESEHAAYHRPTGTFIDATASTTTSLVVARPSGRSSIAISPSEKGVDAACASVDSNMAYAFLLNISDAKIYIWEVDLSTNAQTRFLV